MGELPLMLGARAGFLARENFCVRRKEALERLAILVVNFVNVVRAKGTTFFSLERWIRYSTFSVHLIETYNLQLSTYN